MQFRAPGRPPGIRWLRFALVSHPCGSVYALQRPLAPTRYSSSTSFPAATSTRWWPAGSPRTCSSTRFSTKPASSHILELHDAPMIPKCTRSSTSPTTTCSTATTTISSSSLSTASSYSPPTVELQDAPTSPGCTSSSMPHGILRSTTSTTTSSTTSPSCTTTPMSSISISPTPSASTSKSPFDSESSSRIQCLENEIKYLKIATVELSKCVKACEVADGAAIMSALSEMAKKMQLLANQSIEMANSSNQSIVKLTADLATSAKYVVKLEKKMEKESENLRSKIEKGSAELTKFQKNMPNLKNIKNVMNDLENQILELKAEVYGYGDAESDDSELQRLIKDGDQASGHHFVLNA